MGKVINLGEYKQKRETLELDGIRQLVKDLVSGIADDVEPKPFYVNTAYGVDVPQVNLDTALQLLVDAQLMLDRLGFGREADLIGDVVGRLFGEEV